MGAHGGDVLGLLKRRNIKDLDGVVLVDDAEMSSMPSELLLEDPPEFVRQFMADRVAPFISALGISDPLSIFPVTAALMSTFAVSWNDAAERNESVDRDTFVTPMNNSSSSAGLSPFSAIRALSASARTRSTTSPGRRSVSPASRT